MSDFVDEINHLAVELRNADQRDDAGAARCQADILDQLDLAVFSLRAERDLIGGAGDE